MPRDRTRPPEGGTTNKWGQHPRVERTRPPEGGTTNKWRPHRRVGQARGPAPNGPSISLIMNLPLWMTPSSRWPRRSDIPSSLCDATRPARHLTPLTPANAARTQVWRGGAARARRLRGAGHVDLKQHGVAENQHLDKAMDSKGLSGRTGREKIPDVDKRQHARRVAWVGGPDALEGKAPKGVKRRGLGFSGKCGPRASEAARQLRGRAPAWRLL